MRPGTGSALLLLPLLILGSAAAHAAPDVPDSAIGEGAKQGDDARVEARLLVDAAEVKPGEPFSVGVLFDLDRGWHIYWRNPGESGLPTRLDWQIDDAAVGPIRWPAPEVFAEQDGLLTTYGYAHQVLLTNEVSFEPGVQGERELRVTADFLVCEVQCIPGEIELSRTLRVGDALAPANRSERKVFERYAARVPVTPEMLGVELDAVYSQSSIRPGDAFRAAITVVPAAASDASLALGTRDPGLAFVPDRTGSVELGVTGSRAHPFSESGFLVTLEGQAARDDPGAEARLAGVLAVRSGRHVRYVEVDLPLPRAPAGTEVTLLENPWLEPTELAGAWQTVPLWQAVLLALLGGLILNLMPCVLPVLAIKVFGITELAQHQRREIVVHGFAYTGGILLSMAVLAATVVGLRAGGTAVGWGFQFQEPLFVAAISAVLLVFALNLFGVFEIYVDATRLSQVGQTGSGPRRSFFEGLLAVAVATPCSAPFLGTAVGFAFASSASVIFAIFLAVGLGLASPYLLVTWVPGWAKLIPRAGPWMIRLRQALAFLLLGTIVWLLWVIGRSVGIEGMTGLLAFLVAVAFATWIFGALQAAQRTRAALGAALGVGGLAVAWLLALPLEARETRAPAAGAAESLAWRAFDPAEIRAQLGEGRPVFVYFTADWCLTCKVNERMVLSDARVEAELARLDVAIFKADWTRRDETIRTELARFGRAGVPMYLVYSPEAPTRAELLPELLTVDLLVDALREAAPRNAGPG
jgi:thiol:disulfide interchange protein DsbD